MTEALTKINKETLVSVGVVLLVVGAVWWAATVDARTRFLETQSIKQGEQTAKMQESLVDLEKNVAVMKAVIAPSPLISAR